MCYRSWCHDDSYVDYWTRLKALDDTLEYEQNYIKTCSATVGGLKVGCVVDTKTADTYCYVSNCRKVSRSGRHCTQGGSFNVLVYLKSKDCPNLQKVHDLATKYYRSWCCKEGSDNCFVVKYRTRKEPHNYFGIYEYDDYYSMPVQYRRVSFLSLYHYAATTEPLKEHVDRVEQAFRTGRANTVVVVDRWPTVVFFFDRVRVF